MPLKKGRGFWLSLNKFLIPFQNYRGMYLEIITPESIAFKGKILSLIVPAQKGYMGILAGHASFIGSLRSGKITFNTSESQSSNTSFSVNEGFMEILSRPYDTTKVSILAEKVVPVPAVPVGVAGTSSGA